MNVILDKKNSDRKIELHEYHCLVEMASKFENPDKSMQALNSYGKIYDITSDDIKAFHDFLKLEMKIKEEYNKYKNGLINNETCEKLAEILKRFGVKFSDEEHCIRILEYDATGVYQEHNDYLTYHKKGSYFCKECGTQIQDFKNMCDPCNQAKNLEREMHRFDPVI